MGIGPSEASPAVQQQVIYAGTVSRSFTEGSQLLERLADFSVSAKHVERLARRIGAERVAERDAEVAAYQVLPLVEKFAVPAAVPAPDLAIVRADAGRLQILDRTNPQADPRAACADGGTAPDEEQAREQEAVTSGHWREDKVGLLLSLHSEVSADDPCPDIPPSFVDATRIPDLVRELSRTVKQAGDASAATAPAETADEAPQQSPAYRATQVGQRRVLASRRTWRVFAPIVAAAARARGFQGAARRAFVGDGSATHWRLQRRFFGSFVPILDFIHALSYVNVAALAGRLRLAGWACYRQWIGWVWQGQVSRVIAALEGRQAELGLPEQGDTETHPRQVVARASTYLRNQQDQMH